MPNSVFRLVVYAFLAALAVGLFVLISNAKVLFASRDLVVNDLSGLRPAPAVIVLGAGVYGDDSLTPVFKERVDMAVAVYQAGLAEKILVSGDNGTYNYNEVSPAHLYLTQVGIPPEDIFLDYAGFDTYDTMYRARAIFGVESAIISTQEFHLPRALFIADALGIEAQGIYRPQPKTNHYQLREVLARVKAVFDVRFHSWPEYLGEMIPIEGDGRASLGEE